MCIAYSKEKYTYKNVCKSFMFLCKKMDSILTVACQTWPAVGEYVWWEEEKKRWCTGLGKGRGCSPWLGVSKKLEEPSFSNLASQAVRNEVYISKMKAKRKANFSNVVSLPQTKAALIPEQWPCVWIHNKCQQLLSLRVRTVSSGF